MQRPHLTRFDDSPPAQALASPVLEEVYFDADAYVRAVATRRYWMENWWYALFDLLTFAVLAVLVSRLLKTVFEFQPWGSVTVCT